MVVAVVMLLSASGNTGVLAFFGMSAGTAVAVINYISEIFSPVESLGMEIQTIQSAFAGIKRINEFLELPEKNKYDGTKSRLAERVDGEDKEGKIKKKIFPETALKIRRNRMDNRWLNLRMSHLVMMSMWFSTM